MDPGSKYDGNQIETFHKHEEIGRKPGQRGDNLNIWSHVAGTHFYIILLDDQPDGGEQTELYDPRRSKPSDNLILTSS